MLKLLKIITSPNVNKKFRAIFNDGDKTDFGARGYDDYTISKDLERKRLYLLRHKKREDWFSPKTAGALSRWILWNKPTFNSSLQDYKRRFNL